MTLTEEEAKTKWCPFARAAMFADEKHWPAINRSTDGDPDRSCFCIASACMAWRWAQKPNPDWTPQPYHYLGGMPRDPRGEPAMYIDDETRGACGLAGRPA